MAYVPTEVSSIPVDEAPTPAQMDRIRLWATWVRNRKPQLKVYRMKNHATSAIGLCHDGSVWLQDCALYRHMDNQWVLLQLHSKGDPVEQ